MAKPDTPKGRTIESGALAGRVAGALSEVFAGMARFDAVPVVIDKHQPRLWGRDFAHTVARAEGFGLRARSMTSPRLIFETARLIDDDTLLDLWTERPDTGNAHDRSIFRESLSRMVEMVATEGVTRHRLVAGHRNGAYSWAKAGFVPDALEDEFMAGLYGQIELIAPLLTADLALRLRGDCAMLRSDPRYIWAIADSAVDLNDASNFLGVAGFETVQSILPPDMRDHYQGRSFPVGAFLLAGLKWRGTLDVTVAEQQARFQSFAR